MEILKLVPECKDNIWGGVKLKEKYGKQTDKSLVAESWELSFHKDGPTRLENGKTLQEMDQILDPICTLCRDHERAGFVEGVKVGLQLSNEIT